ncbi:MAG TPA: MetQ/NlpA family ABC transporter substrate-binding protein [Mobilitalea sp.]|nr:MetQ/NlpA family ABC transporter substrate-binding protein [Mobilitalea sp.]
MKKIIAVLVVLTLFSVLLTGCQSSKNKIGDKTIVVGASSTPHAEILEQVKPILEKEGYKLKIVVYNDYVQPNMALQSGDLDANYFQHKPYLDQFNKENKTDLVSAAAIHYEPLGIYPGKAKTFDELKDGAQIAVPNDATNEARALLLLETNGLISLKQGAGLNATVNDILDNPKNLKIVEMEGAQIPRSMNDLDMAVINGNYALQAGMNVSTDAIAVEAADSEAADSYANIIAVKSGNENGADIQALVKALQSDQVKQFINDKYKGAVVPKF